MGGKRTGNKSGGKRRMGHIGFQANEIAFIEDEMAAIAAEYGLDVDQDVAKHVHQRKDAKKARHRKLAPTPASKYGPSTTAADAAADAAARIALHPLPSRFRHSTPLADVNEHGEIWDVLRDVLPENGTLGQCGVPGCNCHHGGRAMVLDARVKKEHTTMERVDALRAGQCKRCHHGVLQHAIELRDDDTTTTKPSGGQRLLSALFALIRLARIAGTVYTSRVWSTSATELLTALLTHMKTQFAAGGTQNGQTTLTERQHEQRVIAELSTLLKRATQVAGTSTRDHVPIQLACLYDAMYFECYYASIVLYGRNCGAVPPPDTYLTDLEHFSPDVQAQLETFVSTELRHDKALVDALALPLSSQRKASVPPALLTIFHARLREGLRLFYDNGVGLHGEMDALLVNPHLIASAQAAVATKKKPQKKHYRRERGSAATRAVETTGSTAATGVATTSNGLVEVPAYALLAQWRNNCRDWCCHLFAYATPTPAALAVLAKHAPLVEIGAGTGYWSSLLQAQGVDIVAYDKCPPTTDGPTDSKSGRAHQIERNAYHGQVPPFCAIGKGGPEVLAQPDMATRTLFLCYPPPFDAMARDCVRLFQGDVVVHVGEWQGDTADRRFEKELGRRFALVHELALPNWGNSAYHLTVWQRKRAGGGAVQQVACRALACFTCHKSIDDAAAESDGDEDSVLRRCVLCKTHAYCSSDCEARGRKAHGAEHALRLVFLEHDDDLDFDNPLHYAPLLNVAALDTDDVDKVAAVQTSWKALTGGKASASAADGSSDADSDGLDDEHDPAHASDDDDSDMRDSDVDDMSDDDSDMRDSDVDDMSDDDDDDDDDGESGDDAPPVAAAPLKKARREVAAKAAPRKPKTQGFAFNFSA